MLVFQDFLTKWPLVFPMPDQKSQRIAELLVGEVIPLFGVPEALLSDRGTNLLSHLRYDICTLLGNIKLNTTAYHPQCDGMVERFNRTLKSHAAETGGHVWIAVGCVYTQRLIGLSQCSTRLDQREAIVPAVRNRLSYSHGSSSTRVRANRDTGLPGGSDPLSLYCKKASRRSNQGCPDPIRYDQRSKEGNYQLGDWVMVKFPQEETGRLRKISRPWHPLYRIIDRRDPDVTVVKIYAPQDGGASDSICTLPTTAALRFLLVWDQTLQPWETTQVGRPVASWRAVSTKAPIYRTWGSLS